MKKISTILVFAGTLFMLSCGGSSEKADNFMSVGKKRNDPVKVEFGKELLKDLVLIGNDQTIRLSNNQIEWIPQGTTTPKRKAQYDGASGNSKLEDAVTIVSDSELRIKIHQDFAIGGTITIRKRNCNFQSDAYHYSYQIHWEGEGIEFGCAFHEKEEYEIIARVTGTGFGTGGSFFDFTDKSGKSYSFQLHNGVDLIKFFPGLEPMSDANPFANNWYKVYYKYVDLEDHRYFRARPVVTQIQKTE